MLLRLLHLLRWVGRRELSKAPRSGLVVAALAVVLVGAVVLGVQVLGGSGPERATDDEDTGLGEEGTLILLQDIGYLK